MVGKKTRDDVLTASIASVAKNESPYKSRQAQLRDNIRAKHGHNTRFEQNLAMELGDFFEDGIIRFAAKKIGLKDIQTEFEDKFEHPFYPVECSLDGMATADKLEIKTDPAKGIYVVEE